MSEFKDNQVSWPAAKPVCRLLRLVQLAWAESSVVVGDGVLQDAASINYDREYVQWPAVFYYYAYGAAVTEVVVDTLTGENRTLRVDILHDCGSTR